MWAEGRALKTHDLKVAWKTEYGVDFTSPSTAELIQYQLTLATA